MANKEIKQAYGEIRKQPAVEMWGCRQGVITRNVHFPTNSCWCASPKVNISAHGYYMDVKWSTMCWISVPCKTVALWGKSILVASDASAILDSRPPNKHFSSSPLPFELEVGSPPNRWLAVSEPGAELFCVFLFLFPSSTKENSSSSFQLYANIRE